MWFGLGQGVDLLSPVLRSKLAALRAGRAQDHGLSFHFTGHHVFKRAWSVLKLVLAGNKGLDEARRNHVNEDLCVFGMLCRLLLRKASPEYTGRAGSLEQEQVERDLGDFPASETNHKVPAFPRERPNCGLSEFVSHRVVHDIDPFLLGDLHHTFLEVLRRVVDGVGRAILSANLELFLRACGRDDLARPHGTGKVYCSKTHATSSTEDEHAVSSTQVASLPKGVKRSSVRHHKA
mmetsp:Transcript_14447/g.25875  ORF Transcript_14447/g.25875 Transcript_14447/m.25875 type:complete len:235 (+) Transcript_14447:70-774(+)